jgi:hypothetical protein
MRHGASASSPRLPSGRLRPSSTGYGEGRGEGALPQALSGEFALAERPPYPIPLPACGEREYRAASSHAITTAHAGEGAEGEVLPGGHAACIVIERVENPTDNRPARLLCCRVADADSLKEAIGPALAPGAFPNTLHAPGARGSFDGSTRSRAEGGTGRRNQTPIPPRASRRGPRSRADVLTAWNHTREA